MRPQYVEVYTTPNQEYVYSQCVPRMRTAGKRVIIQETLRTTAETACCYVCREYGTWNREHAAPSYGETGDIELDGARL